MSEQLTMQASSFAQNFSRAKKIYWAQENISQQQARTAALQQLLGLNNGKSQTAIGMQLEHVQQLAPANPVSNKLAQELLANCKFNLSACYLICYINGHYVKQAGNYPFDLQTFANLWQSNQIVARANKFTLANKNPLFLALNLAFSTDGAEIIIPANITLEIPIVILNIAAPNTEQCMLNTQNHIHVGKNSKVELQEIFIQNGDLQLLTNIRTTLHLEDNANCNHTILQQTSDDSQQNLAVDVLQAENSVFNTQVFSSGGNPNQVSLHVSLAGSNASCNVQALEYTKNRHAHALDIQLDHKHANSTSNTMIKSILDNNSRCFMDGKILVAKHANKVNAALKHKTLLISEFAKITSKPELEIYNDDVICTHSSTIGQLDANALLYMNARGISTFAAQQLLLQSFANPIINSIPTVNLQQYINQLLFTELSQCSQ